MRHTLGLAAVAAAATALWACEASRTSPCPGDPVGTFAFHATLVASDGGACPFAPATPLDFKATVAYGTASDAYLCVERNDAQPLQGTRDGGHLELARDSSGGSVSGCSCNYQVTESLTGDVQLGPDGRPSGFQGVISDAVAPPPGTDPAACEPANEVPDAGPTCNLPCRVTWTLVGS